MTKEEILSAIRRAAASNGGAAPGQGAFLRLTGIERREWFGVYWRNWTDACTEAGVVPNAATPRMPDDEMLRRYCVLARELGRVPTKDDFRLKKRLDSGLPSETTFVKRFGSLAGLRSRAADFAQGQAEFADVSSILAATSSATRRPDQRLVKPSTGFVYMVKHGSRAEYTIGKTLNPLRRVGEVRLQLPDPLTPVHYIETDDPAGIEAYWHSRFAAKRKEGEWFALSRDDVAAFKKWRRIV